MEDLHCIRSVRSNPALTSLLIAQRQMSASTPPILNSETRLPLPEECHIPLPPSPTISESYPSESNTIFEADELSKLSLPIPLLELLHTIQEDNYESRRLISLQDEAFGLFHKCGSCDRFLTVQAQLYRSMMDCFRNDKKSAFASLYTKAMSYPAFGELHINAPTIDDELEDPSSIPWTDRLPPDSRLAVMDFLLRLRSDPEYVADRISRLSTNQLKRLTRLHGPLESGPIFRNRQTPGLYDARNGPRGFSKLNDSEPSVEDLLSDPLLLMIHGVFDRSNSERSKQVDIWSSVCAKLVEEGKPGSDEFCITVLNVIIYTPEWTAIPKLELLLSEIVSSGGSQLEHGSQDSKFSFLQSRTNISALSSFLDRYIPRLLDIFCDNPAPSRALDLVRRILSKIKDPSKRLAARNFFFLRWYCASFLSNAITYPENHSILLEHHINNSVRQKILRELAVGLQNSFTKFLSAGTIGTAPDTVDHKTHRILQLFEPSGPLNHHDETQVSASRCFLFLRSTDVLAMARALTPLASPESNATSIFESVQSPSAPSVAYNYQFVPSTMDQYVSQTPTELPSAQSPNWHTSSPMMDSGYNSMDKGVSRPRVTENIISDSEKYGAMPFIHDLWTLDAGLDYGSSGSTRQEVAVIFVDTDGRQLSLNPFENRTELSVVNLITLQGLNLDDQRLLTAAILQLADRIADIEVNYSSHSLTTLNGVVALFQDQANGCNNAFDYQGEYFWKTCLQILKKTEPCVLTDFVAILAKQRRGKVTRRCEMADQYEDWLHVLRTRSNIQDQENQKLSLGSKRLRNKMWFVSDVRHSSAYEDAYNVVRTLRAMLEPSEQKQAGVAGWAKQKFRSSFGQERALAQLLELMTAPKTYGGPNKLSENQVEFTSGWLLQENIENFCRGEERIHRFCYEIHKCIKRLAGEAMLDSPVLWSSPLYANEKLDYGVTSQSTSRQQQDRSSWRMDPSYSHWPNGQTFPGQPSFPGSEGMLPAPSPTRQFLEHSPQMSFQQAVNSSRTSGTAQGPRNWTLPPSPISPGNVKISYNGATLQRRSFLQNLRMHLTSLLLSDLGAVLWRTGSETDRWISTLNRPSQPSHPSTVEFRNHDREPPTNYQDIPNAADFDFKKAYKILLQRFNLTTNPQNKLRYLHEFFILVSYAQHSHQTEQAATDSIYQTDHAYSRLDRGRGLGVPRTRLTRLQEVAANCEDRRLASISNSNHGPSSDMRTKRMPELRHDSPDLIAAVQTIFEDPLYRPETFFRDLQYIAAFIPGSILDHTPQGTAFWTIGLAAMRIKSELCKTMTDKAMQILDFHYSNGNKKEPIRTGQANPVQNSSTVKLSHQDLLGTTLADAAHLLTKSALEGDPTAARELALFYLTHPELVSRVTLPLSRPSDVFRVKHGLATERGNRNNGIEESGVLDSVTFAVVFHWMEFAASAGDADAITFFKENKDLGTTL